MIRCYLCRFSEFYLTCFWAHLPRACYFLTFSTAYLVCLQQTLQQITDKHAPVRKLSNKMRAQLRKPWITSAIFKSIKKRQKLFTTHFLSNDPNKVKEYKKYNNKLNKIKEAAKTNYFKTQFDMFSDNLKATWKLIGTIINRKKPSAVR